MTPEDQLQSSCIKWFRSQFPDIGTLMFAVPNGGNRNIREAQKLKLTGVTAGVADLILLIQKHGYGSLCIEIKVKKGDIYRINGVNHMVKQNGTQSANQHEWELIALSHGNKYVICRNVNEFKTAVLDYLKA